MSKKAKEYRLPDSETYKEGVFEFAKQWCDADDTGHRGAMIMLTDAEGTHYMFVGNKQANIKGAYDMLTSRELHSAGRCVQITFETASCIVHIDKEAEKAGIDPSKAKNSMEREAIYGKVPDYSETIELIKRLNEEMRELWQEK